MRICTSTCTHMHIRMHHKRARAGAYIYTHTRWQCPKKQRRYDIHYTHNVKTCSHSLILIFEFLSDFPFPLQKAKREEEERRAADEEKRKREERLRKVCIIQNTFFSYTRTYTCTRTYLSCMHPHDHTPSRCCIFNTFSLYAHACVCNRS